MEQLRKEFQRYDGTKDGFCDTGDFKRVLSKFGVNNGVNNVVKKFRVDEKKINYADFLSFFEKSRSQKKTTVVPSEPTKPVITQQPKAAPKQNVENKLVKVRSALEREIKSLDKFNSGNISRNEFLQALNNCGIKNEEALNSVIGKVSSGDRVKYNLFLSLIAPSNSDQVDGFYKGDPLSHKAYHTVDKKMLESFGKYDPSHTGLISEPTFRSILGNTVRPHEFSDLLEIAKQNSVDGSVDYNNFMLAVLKEKRDNSSSNPVGIKTFKPVLESSADLPRYMKDEVKEVLETPDLNAQKPHQRSNPTFESHVFDPPTPQERNLVEFSVTKFSEHYEEEKKRGIKTDFEKSQPKFEEPKGKQQFLNSSSTRDSEENPLSITKRDVGVNDIEKQTSSKINAQSQKDALNTVRDVLRKHRPLVNQITEKIDDVGGIPITELKTVLSNANIGISDDQLNVVLGKCDRNGDGVIDHFDFSSNLLTRTGPDAQKSNFFMSGVLSEDASEIPTFKSKIARNIDAFAQSTPEPEKSQRVVKNTAHLESSFVDESAMLEESFTSETPNIPKHSQSDLTPRRSLKEKPGIDAKTVFKISEKIRSEKTMQNAYRWFDEDKDGSISKEDMTKKLKVLGFNLSSTEIESLMGKNNDRLDYNGFSKLMEGSFCGFNSVENNEQDQRFNSPSFATKKQEDTISKRVKEEMFQGLAIVKPVHIREALNGFDSEKLSSLPPEKFKQALRVVNPCLPSWVLDRAVKNTLKEDGRCDYEQFFSEVGINLPTEQVMTKRSLKTAQLDSEIELSSVDDPSMIYCLNHLSNTKVSNTFASSGDIIAHRSPVKGEISLEKQMGKKKLLNSSTFSLNTSLITDEPLSPIGKKANSSFVESNSPRSVRYSSTPPVRNPIFGEASGPVGLKTGYTLSSRGDYSINMPSIKTFEKNESLASGLGTFLNDKPETKPKINSQMNNYIGEIIVQTPSRPETPSRTNSVKHFPEKFKSEISKEKSLDHHEAPPSPRGKTQPRNESKEQLLKKFQVQFTSTRNAFRKMDSNCNGQISVNDIQRELKTMNLHMSKDEVKKLFKVADQDKITYEKFSSVINPPPSAYVQKEKKPEEVPPKPSVVEAAPASPRPISKRNESGDVKDLLSWSKPAHLQEGNRSRSVPTKRDAFVGSGNIITWA